MTLTCVIHDSLISIIIGWKSFLTYFFYLLYLFRRYWKNLHSDTFWILKKKSFYIYHEIADALLKKGSTPIVCQSRTCIYLGIPLTSLFLLLPDWGGWLPFPHSLSADISPRIILHNTDIVCTMQCVISQLPHPVKLDCYGVYTVDYIHCGVLGGGGKMKERKQAIAPWKKL